MLGFLETQPRKELLHHSEVDIEGRMVLALSFQRRPMSRGFWFFDRLCLVISRELFYLVTCAQRHDKANLTVIDPGFDLVDMLDERCGVYDAGYFLHLESNVKVR